MATTRVTVIPAYGRDYTSVAKVAEDYHADKDFIVQDFFSGQDGRAVNKQDAEREGITLMIRYAKLTKQVASDKLPKAKPTA
jgi:uncharacterized protein YdaU (DUF1376 family)